MTNETKGPLMTREQWAFFYSPTMEKPPRPTPVPVKKRGTVVFWNFDRGFGYIVPDDGGPELWTHAKAILSSAPIRQRNLIKGQFVEYEAGMSEQGPIATCVRALQADEIAATRHRRCKFAATGEC